jgi:hypothetical protein
MGRLAIEQARFHVPLTKVRAATAFCDQGHIAFVFARYTVFFIPCLRISNRENRGFLLMI